MNTQTEREQALEREISRLKDINKERQAMIDEAKEDRAALIKHGQELNALVQFRIDREAGFLDRIKELEKLIYATKQN